jgi:hypothetical protein
MSLCSCYESGLDLTELGRWFNMHRQTARSHLLRRGFELRVQYEPLTELQRTQMVAAYEAGLSSHCWVTGTTEKMGWKSVQALAGKR